MARAARSGYKPSRVEALAEIAGLVLTDDQHRAVELETGSLLVCGYARTGKTSTALLRAAALPALKIATPTLASQQALLRRAEAMQLPRPRAQLFDDIVMPFLNRHARSCGRGAPLGRQPPLGALPALRASGASREEAVAFLDAYAAVKRTGLSGNRAVGDEEAAATLVASRSSLALSAAVQLMRRYETFLGRSALVDAEDVSLLAAHVISISDRARADWLRHCPALLIDGAQDLSAAQWALLDTALGTKAISLFGDDDASTVGDVGAMSRFVTRHPHCELVTLLKAFDSGKGLLEPVLHHAAQSTQRIFRRTYSTDEEAAPPKLFMHESEKELTAKIVDSIVTEVDHGRMAPRDFAILGRAPELLDRLAQVLRESALDVERLAGAEFGRLPEFAAALAAARCIANNRDVAAFRALSQYVPAIHPRELDRALMLAHRRRIAIDQAVKGSSIEEPVTLLVAALRQLGNQSPLSLARWLEGLPAFSVQSGSGGSDDEEAPLSAALQSVATEIVEWSTSGPTLRLGFDELARHLEHMRHPIGNVGDAVVVADVEAASGRRWPVVHLVGYSNGILPARGAPIEAERQLSYLALTRATRQCVIHHAETLTLSGREQTYAPSSFATELGLIRPALLAPQKEVKVRENLKMRMG